MSDEKNLKCTAHQQIHNRKDDRLCRFQCSFCPFKAATRFLVQNHLRCHLKVKEFSCDLCPFRTNYKPHLKIHHKCVHLTERPFKCPQADCQFSFKQKSTLSDHMIVHSTDQPFVCSFAQCNFKTKRKLTLKSHEMAHRGEKPFKCPLCPRTFTSKSNLAIHTRVHTGEAPYACKKCPYRAKQSGQLDRHVTSCHAEDRKKAAKFKCNFCDYASLRKDTLMDHIRTHTGEKPHQCRHPNCEISFSTTTQLKRHQLVHNKEDDNVLKFKCPNCPYKTGQRDALAAHLTTHSEVKPFACDLCPFRAKDKRHIGYHYKNMHSNERALLKCPQPNCSFSTKLRSSFNRHLKDHLSDKPFKCPFANCDYKTNRKDSLRIHELVHRKEKPFKCAFCPYTTLYKAYLTTHIRVHTGETPYPCPICPYRTKTSCTLTKHVSTVHQKKRSKQGAASSGRVPSGRKPAIKCKILGCGFSTAKCSAFAIHLDQVHSLPRVSLTNLQY